MPLTALAVRYQFTTFLAIPEEEEKSEQDEQILISESIINHITVASLANEDQFMKGYDNKIQKNTLYVGLAYSVSWFLCNFYFFITFYIAAKVLNHSFAFEDLFSSIAAGILGSTQLGVALQNAPDWKRGKESAKKVLKILNSPAEGTIPSKIVDGDVDLVPEFAVGDIEFIGVWFKYPTSCDSWVLKNFNLLIKSGESIGIAGESGCGKSTLFNLLLRFYDPQRGEITINRVPIKAFTLKSLRACFGLVQQEPVIFNTSIMENI